MYNKRTDRVLTEYRDLQDQEDIKPFIAIILTISIIAIVTIFVHLTF